MSGPSSRASDRTAGVGDMERERGKEANRKRTRRINVFALFWGLPLAIWQVAFFAAPLLFLVALSFWTVQNYRLTPDLTLANWTRIFNTGFFWAGYTRSLWYAAVAAL